MGGNAVDAPWRPASRSGVLEPERLGPRRRRLHDRQDGLHEGGRRQSISAPRRPQPPRRTCTPWTKRAARSAARRSRGLAATVPGELKGLLYALEQYGSKKLHPRADPFSRRSTGRSAACRWTANLAQIIRENFGKLRKYEHGPGDLRQGRVPPGGGRHDCQQGSRQHASPRPGAWRRRHPQGRHRRQNRGRGQESAADHDAGGFWPATRSRCASRSRAPTAVTPWSPRRLRRVAPTCCSC